MKELARQWIIIVLSLLLCGILKPSPTAAESFATATSRQLEDESLRERLILFQTSQTNESFLQHDDHRSYLRNLKMGKMKRHKHKHHKHMHHEHRHHKHKGHKRKVAYTWAMMYRKHKGNTAMMTKGRTQRLPTRYVEFIPISSLFEMSNVNIPQQWRDLCLRNEAHGIQRKRLQHVEYDAQG